MNVGQKVHTDKAKKFDGLKSIPGDPKKWGLAFIHFYDATIHTILGAS